MGLQTEIKNAVRWDTPDVDLDTNLREIIEVMVRHDAPAIIVKAGGKVAGVVTELDVLDCITSEANLDTTRAAEFLSACELIPTKSMNNPCVQLDENESVGNAIKLLSASGTHNLVVTGKDKHTYGMISSRDLLKLLVV